MADPQETTADAQPETPEAPPADGQGQPQQTGDSTRDAQGRFASQVKSNGEAGDAAAVEPQQATPVADWRKDLPEDLAKTAEKFTSPVEALKSYRELEKRLGRSVTLPGKDASEEEITAFYRKIGVPEDPSGYEVKLPEDLPEELKPDDEAQKRIDAFKAKMHAAGARPETVQAAIDAYYGMMTETVEAQKKALDEAGQNAEAELQKEWGDDFKANATFAQRMVQHFDPENRFAQFLENAVVDGKKLGDHPEFLRFFASAGRAMTEDTVHLSPSETEVNSINQQIDKLREQRSEAMAKGQHQRAMQLDEEERKLYATLSGGAPVVGSAGRTY